MAERFCQRCEKMVPERGIHSCIPVPKVKTAPSSNAISPLPVIAETSSNASSNVDISLRIAQDASSNKPASRNARWRAAHPEQYRVIMRDYMRKRRAKE
jgi:hypothetical protein